MSHKDNQDLRNTNDGGWFYAENDLFSTFAPLIGPMGVAVYMAMCRLVPLAAVDGDRQVSVRTVMEASQVKRTTTAEKMREIVALGMVLERVGGKNRASTYKLVSLRNLAKLGWVELTGRLERHVGLEELEKRFSKEDFKRYMSVRRADSSAAPDQGKGELQDVAAPAESRAYEPDAPETLFEGMGGTVSSPASFARIAVRPADTASAKTESAVFVGSVSAETGSVSARKGLVSAITASVSAQSGHPLTEEEEEEEESTPLPPAGGGLERELVLPPRSSRPADPKFEQGATVAAEWAMERLGIVPAPRRTKLLATALAQFSRATNQPLTVPAKLAVERREQYLREHAATPNGLLPYGFTKFYGLDIWLRPENWRRSSPSTSQAQLGMHRPERDDRPESTVRDMDIQQRLEVSWALDRYVSALPRKHQFNARLWLAEAAFDRLHFVSAEELADGLVWTMHSPAPRKVRAALEQLRPQLSAALRKVLGKEARIEIVGPEEST